MLRPCIRSVFPTSPFIVPIRPASGMSPFIGPSNSKNQCLTKSVVQDCTSLGENDLVSKSHLEAMRLLIDFRGAYQQLEVGHGRTEAQLRFVELKARETDEVFDDISDKLEA